VAAGKCGPGNTFFTVHKDEAGAESEDVARAIVDVIEFATQSAAA
jgi:hypothetical protein